MSNSVGIFVTSSLFTNEGLFILQKFSKIFGPDFSIFVSLQTLICLFIFFVVPFDKILGDDDKFLEFWEVTSNSWNFRKKNYAFKVRF